jgi:hypothetical protein
LTNATRPWIVALLRDLAIADVRAPWSVWRERFQRWESLLETVVFRSSEGRCFLPHEPPTLSSRETVGPAHPAVIDEAERHRWEQRIAKLGGQPWLGLAPDAEAEAPALPVNVPVHALSRWGTARGYVAGPEYDVGAAITLTRWIGLHYELVLHHSGMPLARRAREALADVVVDVDRIEVLRLPADLRAWCATAVPNADIPAPLRAEIRADLRLLVKHGTRPATP